MPVPKRRDTPPPSTAPLLSVDMWLELLGVYPYCGFEDTDVQSHWPQGERERLQTLFAKELLDFRAWLGDTPAENAQYQRAVEQWGADWRASEGQYPSGYERSLAMRPSPVHTWQEPVRASWGGKYYPEHVLQWAEARGITLASDES